MHYFMSKVMSHIATIKESDKLTFDHRSLSELSSNFCLYNSFLGFYMFCLPFSYKHYNWHYLHLFGAVASVASDLVILVINLVKVVVCVCFPSVLSGPQSVLSLNHSHWFRVVAQVSCDLVPPKDSRPTEGLVFFNIELSPMASPSFQSTRWVTRWQLC